MAADDIGGLDPRLAASLENVKLAEQTFGSDSAEYRASVKEHSALLRRMRSKGELDGGGFEQNRTLAEMADRVTDAVGRGDLHSLRNLALQTLAAQLTHKDPKIRRDAAVKLANELRADEDPDGEIRVVEYVTPASPGWETLPPATHWLPPDGASPVGASA